MIKYRHGLFFLVQGIAFIGVSIYTGDSVGLWPGALSLLVAPVFFAFDHACERA